MRKENAGLRQKSLLRRELRFRPAGNRQPVAHVVARARRAPAGDSGGRAGKGKTVAL
jgi:hypothetical protein